LAVFLLDTALQQHATAAAAGVGAARACPAPQMASAALLEPEETSCALASALLQKQSRLGFGGLHLNDEGRVDARKGDMSEKKGEKGEDVGGTRTIPSPDPILIASDSGDDQKTGSHLARGSDLNDQYNVSKANDSNDQHNVSKANDSNDPHNASKANDSDDTHNVSKANDSDDPHVSKADVDSHDHEEDWTKEPKDNRSDSDGPKSGTSDTWRGGTVAVAIIGFALHHHVAGLRQAVLISL